MKPKAYLVIGAANGAVAVGNLGILLNPQSGKNTKAMAVMAIIVCSIAAIVFVNMYHDTKQIAKRDAELFNED